METIVLEQTGQKPINLRQLIDEDKTPDKWAEDMFLEHLLERVRSDLELIDTPQVFKKLKELEVLLIELIEPWNY